MPNRRQYLKDYRERRKAEGWKREYTPEQYVEQVLRSSDWNKANKVRRRQQPCNSTEGLRLRRYGLTPEQYKADYERQGGLCALLCGRPIEVVDHDHDTEQYRALLCRTCNSALGMLDDDPELMRRAAQYVEDHRGD